MEDREYFFWKEHSWCEKRGLDDICSCEERFGVSKKDIQNI
jgi:hypothetical protein